MESRHRCVTRGGSSSKGDIYGTGDNNWRSLSLEKKNVSGEVGLK